MVSCLVIRAAYPIAQKYR
ncbi:uncharacterized protein FFM5_00001 [Fusarium fujikuroi]|nr:uncharacterized protein FFM5_00001 [Fusarium fujikuroi]